MEPGAVETDEVNIMLSVSVTNIICCEPHAGAQTNFLGFFCQSSVRHQVKAECDACLPSLFSVEVRRPGASTLIWHFLKMLH